MLQIDINCPVYLDKAAQETVVKEAIDCVRRQFFEEGQTKYFTHIRIIQTGC